MCSYPIASRASASGSVSPLCCGLVRERGTVRTSATRSTWAALSKSTNSLSGRVECPKVKNGCAIWVRRHSRRLLSGAKNTVEDCQFVELESGAGAEHLQRILGKRVQRQV